MAYFSRKLLPREENYSTVERTGVPLPLGWEWRHSKLPAGKIESDHRVLY